MLVVQGEEKKVLQDSPIRQIRNMANFGDLTPETPTQTQEVSLMLISNFPEFERTFLQNNGNSMSIIFVLNKKQQLEEVTSKVSSLVNQYSERFEFYNYICKGANDNVNVMSSAFPLVLVYSGGKRLMEIPLGSNLKTLTNLLERVQPSDNKGAQEVIKPRPASSTPKNNKTEMILNHIEELFEQNDITGNLHKGEKYE